MSINHWYLHHSKFAEFVWFLMPRPTKAEQEQQDARDDKQALLVRAMKLLGVIRIQTDGRADPDIMKATIGETEATIRKIRKII